MENHETGGREAAVDKVRNAVMQNFLEDLPDHARMALMHLEGQIERGPAREIWMPAEDPETNQTVIARRRFAAGSPSVQIDV